MSTMRRLAFVLVLVVASNAAAQEADQTEQIAAARALFEEGVQLASERRFADAAERFRRSLALHATPSARFNLAIVQAERGHVVEAAELFEQLSHDASITQEARDQASERARELAPRLAHLRVDLRGDPEGTRVLVDERRLARAAIGVALPADPGRHHVEARRGASIVAAENVELAEAESRTVTLTIPFVPRAHAVPSVASRSVLEEWWLWTIVGVVIVGAAVGIGVGVAVGSQPSPMVMGTTEPPFVVVP